MNESTECPHCGTVNNRIENPRRCRECGDILGPWAFTGP